MSDRSNTIRRTHVAGAVLVGVLTFSAALILPLVAPTEHGGSVHAKNGATPDWILERHTQNAHQPPVVIDAQEPSFWI